MATTISTDSPKLTANIADHADVYGGRALVFDGVTDALSIERDFAGAFSISFWIKPHDVTDSGVGILGTTTGDSNYIRQFSQNVAIRINSAGATYGTGNVLANDVWTFLVITRDDSNVLKWYVDSEYIGSSATQSGTFQTDHIGRSINAYFNGAMCDVKYYNVALSESEVQSQYLKPESIPNQNSLLAWYPMCEGNPESPQSIVYDHSEKGLSSELASGGSWYIGGVSGVTTSKDGITSTVSYDDTSASDGAPYRPNLNFNTKSGSVYKIVYTPISITGTFNPYFYLGGSGVSAGNLPTFDASSTVTMYFIGSGSQIALNTRSNSSSYTATFTYSLKEVLMGNHATTKFFSTVDEIEDGAFATNTNASTTGAYWTTDDAWSIGSGVATCNFSGSANKSMSQGSGNGSVSAHPLTAGKTYRVTGTVVVTELNGYLSIGSYGSNFTTVLPSDTADGATVNFDEEIVADTGQIQIRTVGSGGANNFTLDNFTAKEVGVSSAGFAIAQEEPVIPQIPLMRYNQKMVFDGYDDKVVLNSTINISSASGQGSVSAVVNISELDTTYRMIIGGTHPNLFAYFGYYSNKFKWLVDGAWNTSSTDIVEGKTYHIVGTWNNTSVKFYVNGVLDWSITDTVVLADINSIGDSTNYEEIQGIVDEVSVWNVELTSAQVQELFNDGVALDATTHSKAPALKAYYRNDGVTTWKNRGYNFASFDGVNDLITRDAINVDYKSVSFWVRPNTTFTTSSTYKPVIFFGSWGYGSAGFGNATSGFTGELITLNDYVGDHKKTAWIPTSGETIPSDSWTHIAFVWDGSKYIIYYNGQPQTVTALDTGHQPLNTNKNIRIATGGTSTTNFFDGDIANVAFWSESLTDAQVLSIYNTGHNGNIASIQSSDLELYYTFNPHALTDADTNTSVQDRSGNDNDSTSVSGAVIDRDGDVQGSPDSITIREGLNSNRDGLGFYFTNPSSNVVRFDGVSEYLDLGVFDKNTWKGSFTISFWMKPTNGQPSDQNCIIGVKDGTGTDSKLALHLRVDGKIRLIMNYEGTTKQPQTNSAVYADKESTWKFISVVQDADNEDILFYVDNSLVASSGTDVLNGVDVGSIEINRALYVGAENKGTTDIERYYNGLLDEVRIYNRALSLAEHQKNYKHQKGKHKND